MAALLIGYARCSTDQQDLTAQRDGLTALGVADNRVYVDHGLTGTNRERPGLREALAACREGDTLVVTKLDRLGCERREPISSRRQSLGLRRRGCGRHRARRGLGARSEGTTAWPNTRDATPSGSAARSTNAAVYGGPALANTGGPQP